MKTVRSITWPSLSARTRSPRSRTGRRSAGGRDRADKPEYKVKMQVTFAFSPAKQMLEFYHNSSFLEHGGSA